MIPQNTLNIINKFLREKEANMVINSIKQYEKILKKLFEYSQKDISEINSDVIFKYLETHYDSKSKATYNHALSVFSTFFKYCLAEKIVSIYPIKLKYWRKTIERKLPEDIDDLQRGKFMCEIEKLSLRDHLINLLLENTGVRRSELVNIQINDINFEKRSIIIMGKGKKIRFVHFTEECLYLLKKYLEIHPHKEGGLILNKKNQSISDRAIYDITSKVLRKIVNRRPYGPHVLRHLRACILLSKGADVRYIADFFGHINTNTTLLYARMPNQNELELFNKYVRW